jgi:hypothetical protein
VQHHFHSLFLDQGFQGADFMQHHQGRKSPAIHGADEPQERTAAAIKVCGVLNVQHPPRPRHSARSHDSRSYTLVAGASAQSFHRPSHAKSSRPALGRGLLPGSIKRQAAGSKLRKF